MTRKHFILSICCLVAFSLAAYAIYTSAGVKAWFATESMISAAKITSLVQQITNLLQPRLTQPASEITKFSVSTVCLHGWASQMTCVDTNCSQLSPNPEERVRSLISNKTVLSQDQEQLLNSIAAQIPVNDVLLLTAASSNHFLEMAALLRNLHTQVFPELGRQYNFSLVVWDLGLNATERLQTEKCCQCQVLTFPFDKFPDTVRELHCYMWKPLLIKMALPRSRKFVIWNDASIRYTQFPGPVITRGLKYGLQLMRPTVGTSIPHRTLDETFQYLGQQTCSFSQYLGQQTCSFSQYLGQQTCSFSQYPELYATWGFFKNDPFILQAVVSPWARCALEKSCMCPREPEEWRYCKGGGRCHRFDQSALGIITATLYGPDVYRVLLMGQSAGHPIDIKWDDMDSTYFKERGCLKS